MLAQPRREGIAVGRQPEGRDDARALRRVDDDGMVARADAETPYGGALEGIASAEGTRTPDDLEPGIREADVIRADEGPGQLRQRGQATDGPEGEPEDQEEQRERRPAAADEVHGPRRPRL